ncbi:MAG: hypothetical protein MAGBODY4_01258 [Candidatus Marinimicrobia bacterium]|nr:hypothetical protein [Candidatus Neomarinimicrobiota bacterium]
MYTRDFFRDVQSRLSPNGIYTTWLDYRVGEAGVQIILKTMESVFDYCWVSLMKSQYFLLHGSNEPIQIRQQSALESHTKLRRFFASEHGRFPKVFKYAIMNTNPYGFVDTVKSVPINSLDSPVLEFEMARLRDGSLSEFQQYILDNYTVARMDSAVFRDEPFDPFSAAGYHKRVDKSGKFTDFFMNLWAKDTPDFRGDFREYMLQKYKQVADSFTTAGTYYHYARWLEYYDEQNQAIDVYETALQLAPDLVDAHYRLGKLYYEFREYQKATEQFAVTVKIDSLHAKAMYHLGRSWYRLGEYETAVNWFKECLEQNPRFDNANRYAGQASLFLRHPEQAERFFRSELTFDPNDGAAKRHLDNIRRKDK